MIRLAPLFHLTEHKGSRLCQTASQHGKRESASGAYVRSSSIGYRRHGQALGTLRLSQQFVEKTSQWSKWNSQTLGHGGLSRTLVWVSCGGCKC